MINDNFKNHNILPPDKIKISKNKARDILVIDSKNRNKSLFPNSNSYTYDLMNSYKNVTEIEIINAYIPSFSKRINKLNNKLDVSYNNQQINSIYLNEGNYWDDDNIDRKGEHLFNNNLKKYKSIYDPEKNEGLQVFYDFNSKKYIFYDKKPPVVLNQPYNGPNNFTLHFQNDKKTKIEYMGNENFIYDYLDNTCGKFLGFKSQNYSNRYVVNNISNFNASEQLVTIKFENKQTLEDLIYLIKIGNSNLSFYFNGHDTINGNVYNSIIVDISSPTVQIKTIDFNNLILELNTYELLNSIDGNPITRDINISDLFTPIVSNYSINELDNPYILLKIPELNRFDSKDTTTQNSFALINMSDNSRVFENSNPGNIKYFNPPLPSIDRLSINFCNHGGSDVNFNGLEHCLIFSIEYINQSYQLEF